MHTRGAPKQLVHMAMGMAVGTFKVRPSWGRRVVAPDAFRQQVQESHEDKVWQGKSDALVFSAATWLCHTIGPPPVASAAPASARAAPTFQELVSSLLRRLHKFVCISLGHRLSLAAAVWWFTAGVLSCTKPICTYQKE